MRRFLGMICGFLFTGVLLHSIKTQAMGVHLDSVYERLGAVSSGLVMLLGFMILFKSLFSVSFFNGFLVATGLFLSFDIVVFHWFFHLHRITNGPEADWLEPVFVLFGIVLLIYGMKRERSFFGENNIKKG